MGQPVFAFVFTDPSQFVPIGTGLCTPDMAMFGDGGGDVLFSGQTAPGSPLTLPVPPGGHGAKTQSVALMLASSATITVAKGKKPAFRFAVCDGSGSYLSYVLGGIALRNTTGGGTGIGQFPGLSISVESGATMLQLSDDNKDNATYEFDVLVQNAAGQIGLIDPRIVNQS
jgi:hypothetical protein